MTFAEAIEHRYKENRIRVESEQILSVEKWRAVNAKVSQIAKILKEDSK